MNDRFGSCAKVANAASPFRGDALVGVLGDLDLEDEHVTIGLEDSLEEAAHRLIDVPGGVLVVLDDEGQPRGLIRPDHLLREVLRGTELRASGCRDVMLSDVLRVPVDTPLDEVVANIDRRQPDAVVGVDENGTFLGWFSPADLASARAKVKVIRSLDRARS